MNSVNIDGLADAISQELKNYSKDVTDRVKNAVDSVSKETNEEIKKHISFKQRSGKYVKAFRIKNAYEDGYKKVNVWYVTGGEHRLTHLLENGHALWQGGRTRKFPVEP